MPRFFRLELEGGGNGERLAELVAALRLPTGDAGYEREILVSACPRARGEAGIERSLDVARRDFVVALVILADAGVKLVLSPQMAEWKLLDDCTLAGAQEEDRACERKCATERARHLLKAYFWVNLCLILTVWLGSS